jgi:hypothetical protein
MDDCHDDLITEQRVLCGGCALNRCGLVYYNSAHLDLMTAFAELDGCPLYYVTYYYFSEIDTENWVEPEESNPLLLKPTKERAIVEYLKNEKWCDEGLLIEALKNYLEQFRNDEELYRVADFYGLERSTLDYWIQEAINDTEI